MKKIMILLSTVLAAFAFSSCDLKVEKIELQHDKTPDMEADMADPYYESLREWKETRHTISYVYFAAGAPPEGPVPEGAAPETPAQP